MAHITWLQMLPYRRVSPVHFLSSHLRAESSYSNLCLVFWVDLAVKHTVFFFVFPLFSARYKKMSLCILICRFLKQLLWPRFPLQLILLCCSWHGVSINAQNKAAVRIHTGNSLYLPQLQRSKAHLLSKF